MPGDCGGRLTKKSGRRFLRRPPEGRICRNSLCTMWHRQERIGVGMTLWPTGPTRGEEANEIEIGNFNIL
jgi:hypothetical protein